MSAIDPGVDDGIKEGANEIDPEKPANEWDKREDEDFHQPSRWWFASTACPLIAGTFGPMASGFNVIALSTHWRQTVPPPPQDLESYGHMIPDPTWVIAVNVVSLVAALVGNGSLLLNMAKRLKFSIAQPITIGGFFLAGILLIADVAAITASPTYYITESKIQPDSRHALTQAFYYAVWAAAIYMIIGVLMSLTVYGALKGHYEKQFELTSSQRTLMLQTMSFITYMLLGAAVYCHIEAWDFVNTVYWANVTLLTIGLGDFSPGTAVGRGLLFPFSTGGILIVGLVVGSIRSLILERGKEKLAARRVEKRRKKAVHNVDDQKQTIKISWFASADFDTDPTLSPAQRREEEFNVMRKVQNAAERERKYFALATSTSITLILWLVGAAIFQQTEYVQNWTYLEAVYFSFTSLMTIGYGDFSPKSNSGKAFFVLWTLLAVPSLTILISNMGDTIVKWFSTLTIWVGNLTVLPGEGGFRASLKSAIMSFTDSLHGGVKNFTPPGIFGDAPLYHDKKQTQAEYDNSMLDRLAERLTKHVDKDEKEQFRETDDRTDDPEKDIQFYHYVLARECRNLQKDLTASPPKQYDWAEWEYYLKLMGDEEDPVDYPGQKHPDILVPEPLRAPDGLRSTSSPQADAGYHSSTTEGTADKDNSSSDDQYYSSMDGNVDRQKSVAEHAAEHRNRLHKKNRNGRSNYWYDWSWLSDASPLMSQKSEAEWILERLSAALERELNRQRKGYRTKPPITFNDAKRGMLKKHHDDADEVAQDKEQENLEKAAKSEE